ncbi:12951_t:CDS:2 [Funneliformis mosseae]|uniref:12951_t:CDS:1 n=1 Tax=Funneliformis mosseae TaxID=27381 RepID=A0A9N9CZZ9_FUNMO|nr:12951_t:CDS:2 [Funneliformis mosseae]
MYFYHLKFELYPLTSSIQAINLHDSSSSINKKETSEQNNSSDPYFVPKDIFEKLPTHRSNSNKKLSLKRSNSFNKSKSKIKSKVRSKSVDQAKNLRSSEIPLIPPTPVSKESQSHNNFSGVLTSSSSNCNTFVRRRKSFTSATLPQFTEDRTLNFDKTHDFRFGNIEIEWFDNIEENMNEELNTNAVNNNHNGNKNETESSESISPSSIKKTKSSSEKTTISPAGEFVPLNSGKTNLSYERNSVESEKRDDLPSLGNHATILAVLAVPSYMTASDFLSFVAPVRKYVSHFRFIRDSAPNKFIVLMKFRHARAAKDFYKQFNARPFSSMEPEICHVVYIKSIEFKSTSIPPYAFPFLHDPFLPLSSEIDPSSTQDDKIKQSTSPLHELPTCPVCLERMDASVTGLLTILCQHTFHCNCLSKWGDSSQKRNYYDTSLEQNECGVCGATENLWICLVCGNIGCGRYQEAHAYCHYNETSHLYALELETQRVWDYAGDGYVHRLIQNKTDGKLVELPGPDAPSQLQQQRHDQVNQDKLDAIGLEYSYLLSTQLSSQRTFYEEKLDSVTLQLSQLTNQYQKLANEVSALKQDKDKVQSEKETLEKDKIPSLIREKKSVERKVEKFIEKSEKLERELKDEKEITKSLLTKQQYLQTQLEDKDAKIKDFEEQIRDLMFFLQAQEKIKDNPDIVGGDVIVPENRSGSGKKKKGKK